MFKTSETLVKILSEIPTAEIDKQTFSLNASKGGTILLFSYAFLYFKKEAYKLHALQLLSSSVENFEDAEPDFSLATGITGLGWLIQHLCNVGVIELEDDEFLSSIDEILQGQILADTEKHNYDLLYGLLGKGIYFLERPESPLSREALKQIILSLGSIGVQPVEGQMCWYDVLGHTRKQEIINIGLAHGQASILSFLVKTYEAGIEQMTLLPMLEAATSWLLQETLKKGDIRSCCVTVDTNGETARKLAWCQGGLGVLKALVDVKRILPHHKDLAIGIDKLLESVTGAQLAEADIDLSGDAVDTTFCHGLSGILHLLNRTELEGEKGYWLDQTLKGLAKNRSTGKSKTGALFYLAYEERWIEDYVLLYGASGIGMSLLSLLNTDFKRWDTILLTN